MIEYLQELRVKDGNNIRIINNHIFKEKCMSDRRYEARNLRKYNNRGEIMATQEQKIIFRKMEEILRNYPKYQKRIEVEIENLKNPQIKKSCGPGGQGGGNYEFKSEVEQIEELKQRISNNISRYEEIIFRIDECLSMVKDHKDYGFIQMKYFDKMTYEEIAEKLDIHIANTYKMRNRILEALEIHFKTQRLIEF